MKVEKLNVWYFGGMEKGHRLEMNNTIGYEYA